MMLGGQKCISNDFRRFFEISYIFINVKYYEILEYTSCGCNLSHIEFLLELGIGLLRCCPTTKIFAFDVNKRF